MGEDPMSSINVLTKLVSGLLCEKDTQWEKFLRREYSLWMMTLTSGRTGCVGTYDEYRPDDWVEFIMELLIGKAHGPRVNLSGVQNTRGQ